MEKFLAALRADYGSAQGWAHAAGIDTGTLCALHAVLVDDPL